MFEFDKAQIAAVLSVRPPLMSAAFSMACARRLVNSLDGTGDGEPSVLIAMGFWETIRKRISNGTSLPSGLEDQIIGMIPDEDDEPGLAAGVWDDALAALSFAAGVLSDSAVESACNAASRAVDTAFRYSLRTLNETLLAHSSFRYIMEGTIVQTELGRQRRDLDDIARAADTVQMTADLLFARAANEAVLPIALCYRGGAAAAHDD